MNGQKCQLNNEEEAKTSKTKSTKGTKDEITRLLQTTMPPKKSESGADA